MHLDPAVGEIGRDPDALEAFYRVHLEAVQRFVARRVTDPHDAADITADVFLAAIDSAHRYEASRGAPIAWLDGIARNVVAGRHRSAGRGALAAARSRPRDWLDDEATERLVARIDTYLTNLQTCAPGRYEAVPRRTEGLMISVGQHDLAVVIPPGTVRDGETFVLTWSVVPATADVAVEQFGDASGWPPAVGGLATSTEFDVATGPVAPCRPITAPAR